MKKLRFKLDICTHKALRLVKSLQMNLRDFWNIPEEWMIYEDDLGVPTLGSHINRFKQKKNNKK